MPQPSTADGTPPDCFTVPVDKQQLPPVPVRASSVITPASPTIAVPGNAPCARSVSAHLPGQALPPQKHDEQQMDDHLVMPLQTYAQNHTTEASPVYPRHSTSCKRTHLSSSSIDRRSRYTTILASIVQLPVLVLQGPPGRSANGLV